MSQAVRFAILGPLEVQGPYGPIDVSPGKQRAILALLLLNANDVVSRDRLVDELWGEAPPPNAVKALQVHVAHLRRSLAAALGDEAARSVLATRSPGYVVHVDADDLDLTRFEAALDAARRALDAGDAGQAHARATEALALWRGTPFADLEVERTLHEEVPRIEELRVSAQELAVEAAIRLGRRDAALPELEALVKEHPLRERLRGQLMLCLYRAGRQAEALEAYQATRRALVDELGIEPGRQLRELHEAILRQDPKLDAPAANEPAAEKPRSAFVGREPELGELVAGLDNAFAAHGRLFLLAGEPGIGKSRLAEELIALARARGARVLVGRCWEAGGAPAYWPWVQSLRAHVRETEPEALRAQLGAGAGDLAQLLPELRELFPHLAQPLALESEGARFRLFEAASSFLRGAAQVRPLVLILDDLHAADEPSLLLLRFLAREIADSRLLVVGAYRNVDPTPADPLTTALTELGREPVTRTLTLAGLAKEDVARFVELTSGEAARGDFVVAIHEETEGNPLFVGEIVRLLAAERRLDGSDAARIAIPQSVRDVIARRLRHLSEECNRMLVLASVLGREFRVDALARVSAVGEDDLFETLDEAMRARVISDIPGTTDRLRFAHVLMRDTLYEGLTSVRRVRLHRFAVEALEALYGENEGPHLAELAHHSVAGSDFHKGLCYARRAGDRALALLAYEEAARLYETALEALELSNPDDDAGRCELLLVLGEAEARAGSGPSARNAFFEAARLARRQGLSRELAHAAAGYGGRLVFARAADDDRLVPLLEDGLAALGDEDIELRARLLARLAGALRDEHSRERRDAVSREAVELARRSGSAAALAYALDGRAAAIVAPDTVEDCLELANELREVAEQVGDHERLISAHFHRFIARVQVGDVGRAEADLAAEREIASELRQPAQLWQVNSAQAMVALATGDFDEAERLNTQALAFGERAQPGFAIPAFRLQRHMLCTFRGTPQEVESMIRDLVAEYPTRPAFRCTLAHLEAELGATEQASQTLHELARNDCAALPFDLEWLYGMSLLAETCARLDDPDVAAVLYRLLLPWAGFNAVDVPEGMRGSVSRYLGLLAETMERLDDARRHFEDALGMNANIGARPWLAHTQRDYARMLLARETPGDRDRALELLADARSNYADLGMNTWAKRASVVDQPPKGRRPRQG